MTQTSATHDITDEQRKYAADILHSLPFAKLIGMRLVDLQPGEAKMTIEMRDDLQQPSGILHGGVTATLIDTAMAFAMRTLVPPEQNTATIDLTVHYLRPHTDGTIECTAKVVRAGKRIFTISADVFGSGGKLIATAISTYTKV